MLLQKYNRYFLSVLLSYRKHRFETLKSSFQKKLPRALLILRTPVAVACNYHTAISLDKTSEYLHKHELVH